jgi:2-amino-4-hydroxy-6-hydroxymethyldihydropteridine diphosphokinase
MPIPMSNPITYRWIPQEHNIYISLGSNIRPEENIPRSAIMLNKFGKVLASSTVWETTPVGTAGPRFLNAVVLLQAIYPAGLLKSIALRRIEIEMGRIRTFNKYAPRPIDIDILIADGLIIEPGLWSRAHLAVPLAELLPELLHPESGVMLAQIAYDLKKPDAIRPCPGVKISIISPSGLA